MYIAIVKMFVRQISIVFVVFVVASGSNSPEWSYEGETGPGNWARIGYSKCSGKNQSPIDIDKMEFSTSLSSIELSGDWYKDQQLIITNNGHTVQATLDGDFYSTGGALFSTPYKAEQFHFHWGATNDIGSEHTISGQAKPGELHIVHYDSSRFHSVSQAMASKKGLAVFGFFFEVDIEAEDNPNFQPIVDAIYGLKPDQTELTAPFNLGNLISDAMGNYWTYAGSLTTPPCYESVVWTVFETPIIISQKQIEKFRLLGDKALSHPIIDNFRPTISRRGRLMYQKT